RGVNVQRLFGSQRALKTVEDFTEFEQRAAYFDGDHVIAAKKGVNALERGSQVHFMTEFQEILDFPPAPKLDVLGKLDPKKAAPAELRGQALFFGKAQCASCHAPPYYTDNLMHNLRAERFYKPQMINNMMASADGPIKTFPLHGKLSHDSIEDQKLREHLATHRGERFCYGCLVEKLGLTHHLLRRLAWHLRADLGAVIRPGRCVACVRRRLTIAIPAGRTRDR